MKGIHTKPKKLRCGVRSDHNNNRTQQYPLPLVGVYPPSSSSSSCEAASSAQRSQFHPSSPSSSDPTHHPPTSKRRTSTKTATATASSSSFSFSSTQQQQPVDTMDDEALIRIVDTRCVHVGVDVDIHVADDNDIDHHGNSTNANYTNLLLDASKTTVTVVYELDVHMPPPSSPPDDGNGKTTTATTKKPKLYCDVWFPLSECGGGGGDGGSSGSSSVLDFKCLIDTSTAATHTHATTGGKRYAEKETRGRGYNKKIIRGGFYRYRYTNPTATTTTTTRQPNRHDAPRAATDDAGATGMAAATAADETILRDDDDGDDEKAGGAAHDVERKTEKEKKRQEKISLGKYSSDKENMTVNKEEQCEDQEQQLEKEQHNKGQQHYQQPQQRILLPVLESAANRVKRAMKPLIAFTSHHGDVNDDSDDSDDNDQHVVSDVDVDDVMRSGGIEKNNGNRTNNGNGNSAQCRGIKGGAVGSGSRNTCFNNTNKTKQTQTTRRRHHNNADGGDIDLDDDEDDGDAVIYFHAGKVDVTDLVRFLPSSSAKKGGQGEGPEGYKGGGGIIKTVVLPTITFEIVTPIYFTDDSSCLFRSSRCRYNDNDNNHRGSSSATGALPSTGVTQTGHRLSAAAASGRSQQHFEGPSLTSTSGQGVQQNKHQHHHKKAFLYILPYTVLPAPPRLFHISAALLRGGRTTSTATNTDHTPMTHQQQSNRHQITTTSSSVIGTMMIRSVKCIDFFRQYQSLKETLRDRCRELRKHQPNQNIPSPSRNSNTQQFDDALQQQQLVESFFRRRMNYHPFPSSSVSASTSTSGKQDVVVGTRGSQSSRSSATHQGSGNGGGLFTSITQYKAALRKQIPTPPSVLPVVRDGGREAEVVVDVESVRCRMLRRREEEEEAPASTAAASILSSHTSTTACTSSRVTSSSGSGMKDRGGGGGVEQAAGVTGLGSVHGSGSGLGGDQYLFCLRFELGEPIKPEIAEPWSLRFLVFAVGILLFMSMTRDLQEEW